MATYQITTPDGATYRVTQPDTPAAPAVDPAALNYDIPPTDENTVYAEPAERQLTTQETLQLLTQAGLRGFADLAGSVYDLPNAAFMGAQWLANEADSALTGAADVPSVGILEALGYGKRDADGGVAEGPQFNLSDFIADAGAEADSLIPAIPGHERAPPMTREDMGDAEDLYDITRFGVGAGMAGTGLAGASKVARARLDTTGQRGPFDWLLRPYMDRPATAVTRDAASGAGAAIGQDIAEDYEAGPLGQFLSAILGGTAFGELTSIAQSVPRRVGYVKDKLLPADQAVPVDPETRVPFSQAQANLAAREVQRRAGDRLPEARETFDANVDELRGFGIPPEATPTFGLLTEDPGLIQLERNFRTNAPDEFIGRDQAVKDFAASKVEGLRNPNADMTAVKRGLDASEESLQMTRDAEALPLLKQAEASGAVVDVAPVLARIDSMLVDEAQDVVINALSKVRKKLADAEGNPKTSVRSLYSVRKEINNIIRGRGTDPNERFAQKELIEVRNALDEAITAASPEFGQYLQKYTEGSELTDAYKTEAATAARGPTNARKVARQILADDIDGAEQVREIRALIAGDPAAEEALRAAFSEEIVRKITTGVEAGDEGYEVSLAAIAKEFKQKQDVLAAVYEGTDGMSVLQQVNALLGHFRGLSKKATPGSDTASLLKAPDIFGDSAGPFGKTVQVGIRHVYGDLKGGGILRRFKLMQALLPTSRHGANQIAYMAQFNPELGRYLLGLPVENIKRIPTNWGLRAAIAADLASEGDNPPEEE